MDRKLIEQFAAGGEKLRQAIQGLDRTDLRMTPIPGQWSIQQLVIHLADSDAIAIDRMKRIITEDNPTLLYADESAYTARLHCDEQSITDAVLLFEVGRRQFARVLRQLPDSSFRRTGTHNKRGSITLGGMIQDYIAHLDHHLKFLHEKRVKLGKPLR
jgi:hypothetical protein